MNYSMQKLDKSRVEIAIDIEKKEWEACIQEAFNKNKHKYRIEGFRAGKVPFNVLVKRYGQEVFYEDALDIALMKYYGEILEKEKEIEPVGKPDIDVKEVSSDGVKVVITLEHYPEVKLGDYKGVTIEKSKLGTVEETAVDAEIERKREATARWIAATDRKAQKGDKVIIDYSGSVDGVKFDGGTAEKQELELGAGRFIPGFEEQVEGMAIGENKDINVKFPDEYGAENLAGKDAVFAIALHEIQYKELSPLDDEFAKDVSEFDTLEEYKNDVKNRLTEKAQKEAEYDEDDRLVEKIVAATEADIPAAMIAEELDRNISDLKMRMKRSGLTFDDYLKYTETTLEQLKEERTPDAEKNVKTRLVLSEIVKRENLNADEEDIEKIIQKVADEQSKTAEEVKKSLNEYDFGRIMNQIVTEKLFKLLRENNNIE